MTNIIALTLLAAQLSSPSVAGNVANTLFGFFEKTEEFRETYEVPSGTQMQVHNANGDIRISQWTEDFVEVYAKKKTNHGQEELSKVDIEVIIDDMMYIRTKYLEKNTRVSVTYTIRVPRSLVVQNVRTSNGNIELNGTRGDTEVMTSNGDIDLKDVEGTVYVETSNGEIDIEETAAVLEAHTSNGDVHVEIYSIPEEGTDITTSNGSIDLRINDQLNADINAATSMGKVYVKDLALESRFTATSVTSTVLKGKLGDGGSLINVGTSNGDVRLYGLTH